MLALSLFTQPTESETLTCKVQPLSDYGFIQVSNCPEYVCANPLNKADFIVIEDTNNDYKLNDTLFAMLNEHGEVNHLIKR